MTMLRLNMNLVEVYELLLCTELYLQARLLARAEPDEFSISVSKTALKTRERLAGKIPALSDVQHNKTYWCLL